MYGEWLFTILKQRWDFYRFSRSLRSSVLLPFYVKRAQLLHYPHPTRPPYSTVRVYGRSRRGRGDEGLIVEHITRDC